MKTNAKRKAQKKYMATKKSKIIHFDIEKEKEMLDFIKKQPNFTKFVKTLIEREMNIGTTGVKD